MSRRDVKGSHTCRYCVSLPSTHSFERYAAAVKRNNEIGVSEHTTEDSVAPLANVSNVSILDGSSQVQELDSRVHEEASHLPMG